MRALRSAFFFILNAAILTTAVAAAKPDGRQPMTVAQLDEKLATARGQSDADLAQVLSNFELSERLENSRLTRFAGTLLGEKSREALILLADKSAFLAPPPAEMPADPPPDAAATRQMLVAIVNYVNTTLRQLPNLIASRQTTGFEDRPEEDRVRGHRHCELQCAAASLRGEIVAPAWPFAIARNPSTKVRAKTRRARSAV